MQSQTTLEWNICYDYFLELKQNKLVRLSAASDKKSFTTMSTEICPHGGEDGPVQTDQEVQVRVLGRGGGGEAGH